MSTRQITGYLMICAILAASTSMYAGVNRGGRDYSRANVQNRSANVQNRQNVNANRNVNTNRNVNANRNVNVNQNVNVNRDVDVHNTYYRGGYGYGGTVVVDDNDWNWGSFAAGAAAGVVTGAVVGAATSSHSTAVVATPAVGTVVTALPSGCTVISGGAAVMYNCNNIRYQPVYQGTTLVYQVVQ